MLAGRRVSLIVLAALVAASCSTDSHKPAPPVSASASSAPASSAPASAAPSSEEAQLQPLLLTADQLGVTFTDAQLGAPTDAVQPCGQPDPRSVVHPRARVVRLLADYLDGLGVAENLSRFASADEAGRVMALLRDGLGCGTGTIAGSSGATSVALSDVQDVTSAVGAAEAFAVVQSLADGSQVTTIAARVDHDVVEFQIGSKKPGGLDPLKIATQGIDKLVHR